MSCNIKWIESDIKVCFNGEISLVDIYEVNSLIQEDARFETMRYQIYDFSEVTKTNLIDKDALFLGDIDLKSSSWNSNIRLAIVTKDARIKELAKAYKEVMSKSRWQVTILEDLAEAELWCVAC